MTINPLKKIWDAGGVAIGSYIMYSRDIATIEIAAAAGLDFVLFDLEHRPHDTETIHDLAQVARLAGMASFVDQPARNLSRIGSWCQRSSDSSCGHSRTGGACH